LAPSCHPSRSSSLRRSCRDTTYRDPACLDHQSRNQLWLRNFAHSTGATRLAWRNQLVAANLPLVLQIAGRMAQRPGLNFEDLRQVGCLGLIRAVEAFDPARGVRFSSFAVPFIRGAMQHEIRDRQALLRLPRSLWELRQRASHAQLQRQQQGLPPLAGPELASQLGCAAEQLQEASWLGDRGRVRSLDAPLGQGEGEEGGRLVDLLAAPEAESGTGGGEGSQETALEPRATAERAWLQQRLEGLDPQRRALLVGRLQQGCTWVELGRRLGIAPRMAQRHCDATLQQLQQEARHWGEAQASGQRPLPPASIASRAAIKV
jgi:RNA polymerase sigma-B factor